MVFADNKRWRWSIINMSRDFVGASQLDLIVAVKAFAEGNNHFVEPVFIHINMCDDNAGTRNFIPEPIEALEDNISHSVHQGISDRDFLLDLHQSD